ncbi:MAG: redoxin domain-containing protein [Dehalococcoidia bacterium]
MPARLRPAGLATVAVLGLLAGALTACGDRTSAVVIPGGTPFGHPAPELVGLTEWTNTPAPLNLAALNAEGKVVLVDFWTYTCVNCIRTLPYLKQWHERYAEAGLVILGVHAPEFEFEKDIVNVRRAIETHGIRYPVALDNQMFTWDAFRNNAWPAKYLVSADGQVRFTHTGEGAYDITERAIREALTAAGHDVSAIPSGGLPAPTRDPNATTITRELYGGYERNYHSFGAYAGQNAYYDGPDRTHEYVDPPGGRTPDVWYLQGLWRNEREAIVHARETRDLQDYLAFAFTARSVNAVLRPGASSAPYEVVLELDGRPLRREEAGTDVTFDAQGRSVVRVTEPRMYSMVILPALGDHELKMRSNSTDFAMYAITFGIYTAGA